MPTLTSLTVNLRGDSSSLVRATSKGLASIRSLSRGVGRTVARVGGLAAAVTGLAGGAGLLAMGKASASSVDAIGKLSTQLGISGTDVQKLGLIAQLSGLKTDDLSKSMQRVTRLVGDAGAGSKEATTLFDRLGLSIGELETVSPVERFRLVVGALNQLGDATQKASIGNKLFEEQWQRLNPLLLGFEGNAKRASNVFDGLGLGIGSLSGGVEGLNDNFTVFGTMITAFRDLVFAKVAPALEKMTTELEGTLEAWIKANGGAGALADTLINKVASAAKNASGLLEDLKNAATGVAFVFNTLVGSIRALGQLGAGLTAAGAAALEGNFSGSGAILSSIPGDVVRAFSGASGEDDPATKELERQTELLRDIADGSRNGGLVF